jgi:hypothetical protein
VEGADASRRRYILVASPLVASASTLPVSAGMVRLIDWAATQWAGSGSAPDYEAGAYLSAPVGATHVRFPSGREMEIDGTRTVRGTSEAGLYTFLAADTVAFVVALNPPTPESDLARLERRDFRSAIGTEVTAVEQADAWARSAYRSRVGPEVWRPLLLAALLLLFAESFLATSGRGRAPGQKRQPTPA